MSFLAGRVRHLAVVLAAIGVWPACGQSGRGQTADVAGAAAIAGVSATAAGASAGGKANAGDGGKGNANGNASGAGGTNTAGQAGEALLAGAGGQLEPAPHPDLPNLVIVYIDDSGYADFGPFGGKTPTPNMDKLASEGGVYRAFHVAQPVCSASRAALLTGSYSNRVGITGALSPEAKIGLLDAELTLPEVAKQKGYATAIFGKWHLGDEPKFLPTSHGFDEYFGTPYSNDMWPLNPTNSNFPPLPLYENTTIVNPNVQPADQATFTTQFTARAVDFIDRNAAKPFLLYVPHPMAHVPLYVSDKFAGKSGHGLYGDVIQELDWSIGQITRAIDDHGLSAVTWIIVTSDNGPWLVYGNHAGSAGPFREGKHTTFEGGTRVGTVMRWPGQIPAGSVVDTTLMNIDILPTFAKLIGVQLPAHPIDGKDVLPIIQAQPGAASPHEAYFLWHDTTLEGVLMSKWKLHRAHGYTHITQPGVDGAPGKTQTLQLAASLFDLEADPGEATDVAAAHPDIVKQMQALASAHETELKGHSRGPGKL